MIITKQLSLVSEGKFHAFNITDQVRQILTSTNIQDGQVLVFYKHTSGAAVIVEHEAGMLVDFEEMLEKITPTEAEYKHHWRGYDQNGAAHLRTGLLGVSVTVPVIGGDLALGNFQEIIILDFDRVKKDRSVIVQVFGE